MIFNTINQWIQPYLPKLALALATLIIGWFVCSGIASLAAKAMKKAKVEESLRLFLKSLIGIALKVLLIVTVASMIGIEMTSFIAVLAAAGFAVGMALQGGLSNFAGGVLILIFKPFKVGDFIDTQGQKGTVKSIQIFHTTLKTPDNKTIILPNGPVANDTITNFSTEKERRVDMVFGIAYEDDFEKAKKIISDIIKKDKRILKEPESFVRVMELANSSVNITVRMWCEAPDYWAIFADMQENVKKAFDKEGISIPYPQMDVHQK